jgi:hypothetical protein
MTLDVNDHTKPQPFTAYGHRTRIEKRRNRVVCTECPWFWHLHDPTLDEFINPTPALKDAGRRHRNATRIR